MAKKKISSTHAIQKARLHSQRVEKKLQESFPQIPGHLERLGIDLKNIRRHSAKMLSAAALATGLVIGAPGIQNTYHDRMIQSRPVQSPQEIQDQLHEKLANTLPTTARPLTPAQEEQVSQIIQEKLGIRAVASLDGNHLNSTFGIMGGEQHMPRYPGDVLGEHDELQKKGITAHRGAFGYFAPTKAAMTPDAEMQEKYYVAVQTLYLPHWNTNYKTLKDWYKFRKVLVLNPTTGKSVVAVIGDAGPAAWTGKQFGGSPEIMQYLELYGHGNKGKAVVFFVDDSIENPLALGPFTGPSSQYLAMK